jgi:hypothetical protein
MIDELQLENAIQLQLLTAVVSLPCMFSSLRLWIVAVIHELQQQITYYVFVSPVCVWGGGGLGRVKEHR